MLAAAVASALLSIGLVVTPVQAASLARITGTVVSAETGRPVGTGMVFAEPVGLSDGTPGGPFQPRFSFTLPPGTYQLRFESDNAGDVNSVTPWYLRGATQTTNPKLKLKAGQTLNLGEIAIPAGASITGVRPSGREVFVYDASGALAGRSGNPPGTSTSYEVRGLRAGAYRIGVPATSTTFPAYWQSSRSLESATAVSLGAAETVDGIDLAPQPYAKISGTLTRPAPGGGVEPGYANVFLMNADTGERVPNVTAKTPTIDGTWSLSVPPGRYKIWFRQDPYLSGPNGFTWYGGTDRADADVIEVGDTDISGLDATLVPSGTASITVSGMRSIVDVLLFRHDSDGSWYSLLGGVSFDPLHRWGWPNPANLDALAPGEYTLRYAYENTELDPASPPTFLGGSPDASHAQTFTVVAGATTPVAVTVVDAAYHPGLRDIDGDGNNDLLLRSTTGRVVAAYGDGHGGIRETAVLTTTISASTRVLFGGDFSRGGNLDVLGLTSKGALDRYWNLTGDMHKAPVTPAPYWKGYKFLAATDDFTGDGEPDLLGLDADDRLAVCSGRGHDAACSWTYLMGTWSKLSTLISPGDFDGDGNPDLLARDSSRRLWLYSGDGHGGFIAGRKIVATGWRLLPAMSPGDFDGDGNSDLVVRDKSGTLWLYRGTGDGHLLPRTKITAGLSALKLAR
jgi:hypothetical protein